jgi:hypothetical protein
MHRVAVSLLLIAATISGLAWLWTFWTPRCNEACPQSTLAAIYSVFLLSSIVGLCIAALALTGRLRLSKAIGLFLISVFIVSILTALIFNSFVN